MNRILAALAGIALVAFLAAPAFADGKTNFETLCASCHGPQGAGDGPAGAALNPAPRNFQVGDFVLDANGNGTPGEDEDLLLVIKNGGGGYKTVDGRAGNPAMAPWGHMGDDAIKDLVAHVRSLKK